MSIAAQVNPPINAAVAAFDTFELNTQAYQAQRAGNLEEAERLFLHTIELKERHSGPNSVTVATSRGMLGEVYLKMGKIEEAEYNLKKAMEVMSQTGASSFNTAITRENLAQLAEMKGDMGEAKALRLGGAPNVMACANSEIACAGANQNSFSVSQRALHLPSPKHKYLALQRMDLIVPATFNQPPSKRPGVH
ncbi:hypothetical protein EYR40_005989 [Pleurotus pulmonarius]|nr:hypothetical protein EYR36_005626 [Pleurotus pulmonarius]KAF4602772.1 hypothetical protein EYR40_005989 [Pleurotus pulmonarius]